MMVMHSTKIRSHAGAEVVIHHHSDWSGDAEICSGNVRVAVVPGWILIGLVKHHTGAIAELARDIRSACGED